MNKQMYILGYDQIPETEQSEQFKTFTDLVKFCCTPNMLTGYYDMSMDLDEIQNELTDNGYYVYIK